MKRNWSQSLGSDPFGPQVSHLAVTLSLWDLRLNLTHMKLNLCYLWVSKLWLSDPLKVVSFNNIYVGDGIWEVPVSFTLCHRTWGLGRMPWGLFHRPVLGLRPFPGWEEGSTSIAHKSWSQVSQLGWDPVEQGFLALDVHEEPAITHFPKPHLWKFWFEGQGRGPEILFPTSSRWCQHCRWVAPCFRGSEHMASIGPERQGIIFSHGEKPLPPKRKEWTK